MRYFIILLTLFMSTLLWSGCTADSGGATDSLQADLEKTAASASPSPSIPPTTSSPTIPPTQVATKTPLPPPATMTPVPTQAHTATPLPPTATVPPPTATPIGPCSLRKPNDDLFTLVTQTYNLSRDYAPQDIVLLTDYLPVDVTLGYPSEIRKIALQPLLSLIADMKAAGLQPQIISGYRSYYAQSIAWDKWNREVPDHAAIVSARPGHSEHQLGTVVDFGSPSLPEIVGTPDIQFHTYFFKTPEGIWLAENAHRYGFTLSYTRESYETTGFYYEPWHYRYVGVEMAAQLQEAGVTLTEFQLANQAEPCIPD